MPNTEVPILCSSPPPEYAELHAHSAFSFLEGADLPEAFVVRAKELEYSGLALLDRDGVSGAVVANRVAQQKHLSLIQGSEVTVANFRLPILATNPAGYRDLCKALSKHHLRQPTHPWRPPAAGLETSSYLQRGIVGQQLPPLTLTELAAMNRGNWFILSGGHNCDSYLDMRAHLQRLVQHFGADNVAVEACVTGSYGDKQRIERLAELAKELHLPLVATTGAVASCTQRVYTAHALAAVAARENAVLSRGRVGALPPVLLTRRRLAEIFTTAPAALHNAARIGNECAFDLRLVAPTLPQLVSSLGQRPEQRLRELTFQGAQRRYGTRAQNPRAWQVIEHELAIIEQTGFSSYFLIVADIANFCHNNDILCQGRGSAANSAVCYALGITAVDAVKQQMLFERFLTPDRTEYPDIDLDIEAERRELVIQYVYAKYGREHAAQVANVVEYQPRSALIDAARVLGYDAATARGWLRQASGIHKSDYYQLPQIPSEVRKLASQLEGLPRHLGLHSGGMIVSDQPLSEICVLQPATHPDRTMVQWDKESCAEAGLVKIDLLGLGMLTALRLAFTWLAARGIRGEDGQPLTLHNIGDADPKVYELLCAADTIGVFQVESRAQMSILPRLRPRNFYDIVVEVALVRPGPIQGDAVNPYIRRRNGLEPVTYLHPLLQPALEKTLGVPLFQEQLMRIATDVGGFNAAQADELRRAISAKRAPERMQELRDPLFAGMAKKGITGADAEAIWKQLLGFAKFGFPESHAFSFAYIVYASAWLKVHYPVHFYAALIAAQPLGFYSVQSLIQDARRHGVRIKRPCVNRSALKTTVGTDQKGDYVQLGLNRIKGWKRTDCERTVNARGNGYHSMRDLGERAGLSRSVLENAAQAGALRELNNSRRAALWEAVSSATTKQTNNWQQLRLDIPVGTTPALPALTHTETVLIDYASTSCNVDTYPTQLLRKQWRARGYLTAAELRQYPQQRVWVAGIVTHRQRPQTANGVVFLTLQDETGQTNVVCSAGIWERYRLVSNQAVALAVRGIVESAFGVVNVRADKIKALEIPVDVAARNYQ